MTTYAEMSNLYRDGEGRARYDMAIREQAFSYAHDVDMATAALGQGVIGGNLNDIDALIAAIVTGPNSAVLANDPDLLAAVQAVWSTVAAARYPDVS